MATIENFILRFKVEGGNALQGLKDDIKDLTANANPLNGVLGNLSSRLGLVGTAALAGVGAFAALGLRASTMADELQDMAAATGIGAGQLLNLKESLAKAGGDANTFVGVANKLNLAIGESMSGNDKYQKSFKDLGIAIRDSNGNMIDSGTILEQTLQALADIEDPSLRAAKAVELLGKEASKIDWTQVKAGKDAIGDEQIKQLAAYRGAIDDLAASIETKLIRVFGELAEAVNRGGFWNALAVGLEQTAAGLGKVIPGLTTLADKARMERLGNLAGGGRGTMGGPTAAELAAYNQSLAGPTKGDQGPMSDAKVKALEESRLRVQKSALEVRKQAELATANDIQKITIAAQYEAEQARADILAKGKDLGLNFAAEAAAKEKEIYAKRDADIAQARRQLNAKIASEEMAQAEQTAKEMAAYYQQVDQARLSAFDQVQSIKDQTIELQGRFDLQQRIVGLSTIEQQRQTELFDLEKQRKTQLDAIAKIKDLPYDERLAREKELNAEYQKRIDLINQEADTRAKRENDFVAGVEESMKKYAESLTPLKQGAAMANSVYSNMGSALDRFVDTGKFKFSDFANSVIMDLLKIQLRATATQLFNSVLGTFGFSLPGRAVGGPVTAGQPYIVGEQGPEVFLPTSSGTIIPNNRLGSNGGGGAATSVVYNIQAVDAPSFRQLVARDPGFIYAVTEQGRKTIPTTRR